MANFNLIFLQERRIGYVVKVRLLTNLTGIPPLNSLPSEIILLELSIFVRKLLKINLWNRVLFLYQRIYFMLHTTPAIDIIVVLVN